MGLQRNGRLEELERRFSELEGKLKDYPEKEAISVLHAMIIEGRRRQGQGERQPAGAPPGTPAAGTSLPTLEDIANLHKSAPPMEGKAENEGLAVGSRAPDFRLPDADGRMVSLSNYRGRTVLLVFYPLDWSPACSDQLTLYQGEIDDFTGLDVDLLAISVDSLYSHGAWAAVRGLDFPLLADFHPKGEVARQYGVWRETDGFSERALFVIDGEGVIRYRTVSPQLDHIPDIYELMDELKKMRELGQAGQAS